MSTDIPPASASTSQEPSKTYEPAAVEARWYQRWLDEGCFTADPNKPGEPYSIVMPPPNVTGALHLGHAINNTLQDILIRNHRMRGFNVLWVPGIDHAGIATQAVVEKQLKEKENKTRHDVGREGLVERIWTWKQQFGDRILEQLKRLGCSCDWSQTAFTLDPIPAQAVRETFFKLFKDGLIYRGKRLVNWDVHLQTSISDDEIYHETVKTSLWHIKYPIEGTDQYMIVATTRPETMLGDTAVAVHSSDARWNQYIGEMVRLPLTNRLIPIIADDILVDPKFGSGVVKVTPAHDPNDYAVWQRHQNKPDAIELINILNPDGTLNENAGKYQGMKRDAALKKVVDDLGHLLLKEEPYETQVGHSDRSKTPVEPYLSDQWFVKMAPLAEPALKAVEEGMIQFFPERHRQQYLSWLGEKRDWPISRQLWWGHRIPVWTHPGEGLRIYDLYQDTGEIEGGYPSMELRPEFKKYVAEATEEIRRADGQPSGLAVFRFCVAAGHPEIEQRLEKLGFVQDPDVLDTWFSSALWPFSTLGWPEDSLYVKKYYPTSVLLTGRDIITLWVARMVMMGLYNIGKTRAGEQENAEGTRMKDETTLDSSFNLHPLAFSSVPFHHVVINPTILDGKGERMSKSKGNGVDPVDIIDTQGADALRFTLATMATETQDARLPVKKDAQGRNTSEKFDAGSKFANKIWQVAQFFILSNLAKITPDASGPIDTLADEWILTRFNRTLETVNAALAAYRFDQYAKACHDFFWGDLCDWYVEAAKPRLRDPDTAGQTAAVLAAVLDGALRLMHPIIPFITEAIWERFNAICPKRGIANYLECPPSSLLIHAPWPSVGSIFPDAETRFGKLQELVGALRNIRNLYTVDPKTSLSVTWRASAEDAQLLRDNSSLVELLGTCTLSETPAATDAVRLSAAGYEMFIVGLVDEKAERERLARREAELTKQIAAMEGRLANAGYIAKAPLHLVEQTQAQLAEAKAELKALKGEEN